MTLVTLTLTLWSIGDHELVHTYLWPQFDEDWGSLRLSNAYFNVWPLTSIIWPWRQKFKIPPHEISAYGPKEHSYAFSALSYQNCGTSSKKTRKIGKKRKWPWWPWLWPCDLEVNRGSWPCPYLPMTLIWWRLGVIKAVKCVFQCLTFDLHYLTLRAKIQNSAAWDLCVWSQRTFLCVFSTLQSKL